MKTLVAVSLLIASLSLAKAEDWTVKNQTYKDVMVLGYNEYRVTIGSNGQQYSLYLADLPPALQQRFHYDKWKAWRAEQKAEKGHHTTDDIGTDL